MTLKQHPLSAAFPSMGADGLARHAWLGHSRKATGALVTARTMLSAKYPGFVHYEVCDLDNESREWSKMPAQPAFVIDALQHSLARIGLSLIDMKWRPSSHKAHDWDHYKKLMDEPGEFVYFLGAGPFVKIGKTSGRPDARISELQTGCPYAIELLAFTSGGLKKESELHSRFSHLRARENGEWFHRKGELVALISSIAGAAA